MKNPDHLDCSGSVTDMDNFKEETPSGMKAATKEKKVCVSSINILDAVDISVMVSPQCHLTLKERSKVKSKVIFGFYDQTFISVFH